MQPSQLAKTGEVVDSKAVRAESGALDAGSPANGASKPTKGQAKVQLETKPNDPCASTSKSRKRASNRCELVVDKAYQDEF